MAPKKGGEGEFEELMRQILGNLEKSGVIRNGGLPHINLVQRRFRTRTDVYARDGTIEFDILRAIRGSWLLAGQTGLGAARGARSQSRGVGLRVLGAAIHWRTPCQWNAILNSRLWCRF
jgi:hypothetical protein